MRKLKRYTAVPQLLHMLATRTITLLSPTTWVDQNDTHFIESYRRRSKLSAVRAICLTKAADTYHHWHVFSSGTAGVKIDFNVPLFMDWAGSIAGATLKEVEYLKLDEIEAGSLQAEQLPFAKRWAFRHEGEVRLIHRDKTSSAMTAHFEFDVSMIEKITLSPWLPAPLVEPLEAAIQCFAPDGKFPVRRTSLLSNRSFMSAAGSET